MSENTSRNKQNKCQLHNNITIKPTEDYDSLSIWLNDVCEVYYCPFCGKKLSDEERSNDE